MSIRLLSNTHLADHVEKLNTSDPDYAEAMQVAVVRLLRLNATEVETYFNRLAVDEAANKGEAK